MTTVKQNVEGEQKTEGFVRMRPIRAGAIPEMERRLLAEIEKQRQSKKGVFKWSQN